MGDGELLNWLESVAPEEFQRWLEQNPALPPTLMNDLKAEAEGIAGEGDLETALRLLDRAQAIAQRLDDPLAMGLVWRGRANVLQRFDRFEDSLAATQEAVRLYEQHSTPLEIAKARLIEVYTLGALGRFDEATSLAGWVRARFEEAGFTLGLALLATNLAQVYTWSYRLAQALQEYETARQLFDQLGRPLKAAQILHDMGVAAEMSDQLQLAEQYFQQALNVLEQNNDPFTTSKARYNLAWLYQRQGRYEDALQQVAAARHSCPPGSPDIGYAHLFEARLRCALRQSGQARALLEKALAVFAQPGFHFERVETLLELSQLLAEDERPEEILQGLEALDQARVVLAEFSLPVPEAQVQVQTGEFLLRLERGTEAAFCLEPALRTFAETGLSLQHAWAEALLADCYQQINPEQAGMLYHSALQHAGETILLLGIRCWHGLARLASAARNWQAAEQAYQTALELARQARRDLRGHGRQAGFSASWQGLGEELLRVLSSQPERQPDIFQLAEQVKAQILADLLANTPMDTSLGPAIQQLWQRREGLRAGIDRLTNRLILPNRMTFAEAPQRSRSSQLSAQARQAEEIIQLRRELQSVDEALVRLRDTRLTWREPAPVETGLAGQLLNEQSMYVSYFVAGGQLHAITASHLPGDIQLHEWGLRIDELHNSWRHLQRLIGSPQPEKLAALQKRLAILWDKLIAPLEGRLVGKTRLLFSPVGVQNLIPFAALYDRLNGCYLMQRWAVQIVPSLAVLHLCHEKLPESQALLLAGYPGEPDQPGYLPGVIAEIRALQALYPGTEVLSEDDATPEAILRIAPGHGLVHLAGHAFYDPTEPLESGMPLANGLWLRASDLYLRYGHFAGATVVISGCQVGLGNPTGSEVLGLTSALLYAGASGVIAGLWSVDDAATLSFMQAFYEHLRAGQDAAQALQEAQQRLSGQAGFEHPYYWAAFQLTGDSRTFI